VSHVTLLFRGWQAEGDAAKIVSSHHSAASRSGVS
jgi:hypothetical protein